LISGQPYISSTTRNYITAKGPGTEDPKRLEYMIGTHGKVKGTYFYVNTGISENCMETRRLHKMY
jgi:hypothetical protein